MDQSIVHLKTTESFIDNINVEKSKEVLDCFIKACVNLNAGIFEPMMQEDDIFQDKEKYQFLQSLKVLFAGLRDENTVFFDVSISDDICYGCTYGKPVKNFKVYSLKKDPNKPGRFINRGQFAFLVELEDGILKDIYRCLSYSLRNKM